MLHDILSLSIRNTARHLEPQNRYSILMRISLFMKTVQTLSLRRTTSDTCSPSPSQRKDSAHLLFYVISLSLLIRCEKPRAGSWLDETIRETSPGAAKRLEITIHYITPRKAGIASVRYPFPKKDVLMQESAGNTVISKIPSNQREILESTRFLRIDKSPSNQPDSSNRTDTRPRLPTTETSPSTACHSSRVSAGSHYPSQEAFRTSTGSWGTDRAGPEPLLVIVV